MNMFERIKKVRRDLHQIPEIGLQLPKTSAYIIEQLSSLPCTLSFPIASSVCAFFDAGQKETVAFRTDMDALAVEEQSGCSYTSKHIGNMHACGHDGHMAMMVAFAYEVSAYYQELPHNILLIFQPGEESPGGAKPICDTGILATYHVKQIYAFHVWPNLPSGVIATRKHEFMARASELTIDIYGKSAHCAKYKEGIDALEISMKFLYDLYEMERNELAPEVYRLLRFGKLSSGTVRNVVANHTRMEGTLRSFQDETFVYMKNRVYELAKRYESDYGARIDIHFSTGYPAVINDAKLYEKVLHALDDEQIVILDRPEMTSEDFSYYQRLVPGLFFFLGTGTGIALHANTFDFDEHVLVKGVETYIKLSKIL